MSQHNHHLDIFVKKHGPQLHADWDRVERFFCTASKTSMILAPQPIDRREDSHEIAYRKLDCSQPLFDQGRKDPIIFNNFGRALRELHTINSQSTLNIDEQSNVLVRFGLSESQSADLVTCFPCGICHGDCWHGNVFLVNDNQFIVLDPIPAPLMSEWMPKDAPGCIDLAYLCCSLFLGHRLLSIPALDSSLLNKLGEMTIDGYLSETKVKFPSQAFNALCMRISDLWIEQFAIRLAYPIRVGKTLATRRLLKKSFFAKN